MKPWTDYLWLDSFFRVPEFVYSWTRCAHLPIYMHLPSFCSVVALVWCLRSETAPLLWFICFLPAVSSGAWLYLSECLFGICLLSLSKLCGCQSLLKGLVDWEMRLFLPHWLWILLPTVLNCALFSEEFITLINTLFSFRCNSYVCYMCLSYFVWFCY